MTNFFNTALTCSLFWSLGWGYSESEIVDLGYSRHKPTWVNTTTAGNELLNYNNIRFAQPPTGERRFRKPQVPPFEQQGIQDGNISSWVTDCISSAPSQVPFPLLNGSTWGSEDCLFLNVIKPRNAKAGDNLPVLHWVVGSAYAFGGKDWTGFGINTYGLYNRPLNLTDQFIIVTHNYRLGIPGWTPKLKKDMDGNLGAWDTLTAIEWTKKYIKKFGGDPDNITVIGQSAGAGIITTLLLAKEGSLKLPFDQAWIASPDLPPRKDPERSRTVFNQILNATDCQDVDCMRHIPESKIRDANNYLFVDLVPGNGAGSLGPGVGLTPTVDGDLLTDLPANSFASGKFNKRIKQLVVGNTAAEGLGLASDSDMPRRFPVIVRANIPNVTDEAIANLQALYPYPPNLPEKLAWDETTDIIFACNSLNIAKAYKDKARRYILSIPPATHGLDISYFFFANNATTPVVSIESAYAAETYLLQYMFRRDFPTNPAAPYAGPLSKWPYYGSNATLANITEAGFESGTLPDVNAQRCAYLNALEQDPVNGV